MLCDQFSAAIAAAPLRALDDIARETWKAFGAGALSDAEADRIAAAIEDRRRASRTAQDARQRLRVSDPSRARPRPSGVNLERRRRLAASAPLPPRLACQFTVGELACLRIVADEIRDRGGVCCLPLGVIAIRAGVCRSTARNAFRAAERIGLLVKTERRRRGERSETNVLRIISAEWRAWMKRGPRQPLATGEGSKKHAPEIRTSPFKGAECFRTSSSGQRKWEIDESPAGRGAPTAARASRM